MSSPAFRTGSGQLSFGGPSRTVLQNLLGEINGDNRTANAPLDAPSSQCVPSSRSGSTSKSSRRSPSAWANGRPAAEDARTKLRALDEARRQRDLVVSLCNAEMDAIRPQRNVLPGRAAASASTGNIQQKLPPTVEDMQLGRSTTMPLIDLPLPTTEFPQKTLRTVYSPRLCFR